MKDILWGVFSPKGELEAVEMTESTAEASAFNLSQIGGKVQPVNRKIVKVTVLWGEVSREAATILVPVIEEDRAEKEETWKKENAAHEKLRLAAIEDRFSEYGHDHSMPDNAWQAKQAAMTKLSQVNLVLRYMKEKTT